MDMKQSWKRLIVRVLFLLIITGAVLLGQLGEAAPAAGRIYVVPIEGEITPAMAAFVANQVNLANMEGAHGLLIEISTLGGRVDAAMSIKDAMLNSQIPIAVYIRDRAVSAGAMISIAGDTIVMAPGSHMGAAEPIPYSEKSVAAISAEFRSIAQLKGRDPQIAAAMVDKSIVIPDLTEAGSLLDMTAGEAKEHGYADAVIKGMDDVLEYLDWSGIPIHKVEPDFKIKIAQFLTRVEVASLILMIGMVAILIEVFTPGFGVPGTIGLICFALYFGGNFLAGNTEWWAVLLFIIGVGLLAAEMAVPGFGVLGISGIIAILVGLVLAASDPIRGLISVGAAILAGVVAIPILGKLLGGAGFLKRLVLIETVTPAANEFTATQPNAELLGKTGIAMTTLRPAGVVVIEDNKIDVVSDGEYIMPGSKIKVIEVIGSKVVVTRI
jgi:membrane-bound serine protease (ClpP class)